MISYLKRYAHRSRHAADPYSHGHKRLLALRWAQTFAVSA